MKLLFTAQPVAVAYRANVINLSAIDIYVEMCTGGILIK